MQSRTILKLAAALSAVTMLLTGCSSDTAATPAAEPSALMSEAVAAQGAGDAATAKAKLELLVANADVVKDQTLVVTAYFNLGVLAQAANESDKAIENYKRALVIDPTYSPALFNIAVASAAINPTAAMTYYGIILSMNPKDANSLYNLGLLKWNNDEKGTAKKLLKAAIAESPALEQQLPADIKLD
ncbi:MAG: hypothetical protein RL441_911 [Actinomycetota bacterium]|jgi:tetratricopeptide (TPR) repeat protein